jgi:hypothetical protein
MTIPNLESMESAVIGMSERLLGVEIRLRHLEDKIELLLKKEDEK